LALGATLGGAVLAVPARAGAPAATAWEAAPKVESRDAGYQLGLQQLDDERYEAAIATFRAALEQPEGDPSVTWQITLGLAWAYQQLGQGAFALSYYDAFVGQIDAYREGGGKLTRKLRAKRRTALKLMKKLRAEVTKTHGVLEVQSDPAGALVTIDGSGAGPEGDARAPYRGYAPAGRHTIRLTKPGFQPEERTVAVTPGQVVVVRATLKETPPAPPEPEPGKRVVEPTPPGPSRAPAPPPAPSSTWPAWTTFGVGLAAVATGATFLVLSQGDASDADALDANDVNYQHDFARLSDRAAARSTVGWVFTGVGAAATVGGLVWALAVGGDGDAEQAAFGPRWRVQPVRGGLAAAAAFRF